MQGFLADTQLLSDLLATLVIVPVLLFLNPYIEGFFDAFELSVRECGTHWFCVLLFLDVLALLNQIDQFLACEGLVRKSVEEEFVTAEEGDEIGSEVEHEEGVEEGIYLHHSAWEEHVHQDERLGEHHDGVAESDPFDLVVLFFVVIYFELLYALAVGFAEFDDVHQALHHEQQDAACDDRYFSEAIVPPE